MMIAENHSIAFILDHTVQIKEAGPAIQLWNKNIMKTRISLGIF